MARWRLPSLTIHKIVTSGSSHGSVIPHKARAVISMRIVPDQNLEQMVKIFKETVIKNFAEFQSDNKLNVVIEHQADWWLGDPQSRGFKTLEKAVAEEWGIEPLYIREVSRNPSGYCKADVVWCREDRSLEYDFWRRNSMLVLLISRWAKQVIMHIWLMNDYEYSIWRRDRGYSKKYLQNYL